MATCDLCETFALFALNELVHGHEAVFTLEAKAHRPEAESIVKRTQGVRRVREVIPTHHAVWPKALMAWLPVLFAVNELVHRDDARVSR